MKSRIPVRIVDYDETHRAAFQSLNEAWITRYFAIEDADRKTLGDPQGAILDRGGHVLVALDGSQPVGVCALVRLGDGTTFELAKMAVDERAQRRGIGEQLARTAIAWTRTRGARRLFLESNTRLEPAIRLYRKLGFVEIPGHASAYARSNIQMELRLD